LSESCHTRGTAAWDRGGAWAHRDVMNLDPALVTVAGALSTVAAILYRELVRRATAAEEEADFWRDRALGAIGLATIAAETAERRGAS